MLACKQLTVVPEANVENAMDKSHYKYEMVLERSTQATNAGDVDQEAARSWSFWATA